MLVEQKQVATNTPLLYISREHKGTSDHTAKWSDVTYNKGQCSTRINDVKESTPPKIDEL